ncbi:MAG: MurR/RpiR family transcriptional regulator [Bacillota bacterium]|nr:MurR/RpiR family transcriptional regulator [Bacillota bacterium]MDW7728947.1 MurR/RpiR family transcriptional regulator [Bacillota bacterium]
MNNSLFERIKEKGDELSPKQVQLANYLINNYKTAAFQTIAQMAKESNVSEATVVRLAMFLDYSGFPEMLDDLQAVVQHELQAFETIRHTYKGDQLKQLNILETVVNNDQRNINRLFESVTINDIETTVDTIYNSDRLFVIGSYSSGYLAQYFGYNLSKVKKNVVTLSRDSTDAFNFFLSCDNKTTAVIFSFPRYPRKMQLLGEAFRNKKATVIGVTDSILSPLKAVSNQLLVIPQQYTSFTDPGCSIMLLLQAIIMEYISRNPDETEYCLQQFDEYVDCIKFL